MQQDADTHWRIVLIVVPIVGTAIATIVYILRLYARHIVTQKLRIEDFFMGMGLFFTWGVAICIVYAAFHGIGIGKTIWVLPREERARIALADWILQKFWPAAQVFVKVSIILFLRRLLDCVERFKTYATMVIVLVVAWGITAIMGNTFQCWPVQYYWIKHIHGDCMSGQNTFFLIIGSLSLAQDVLILCLPLPIVWKLQAPIRQKIEITLLFSIGCMYAEDLGAQQTSKTLETNYVQSLYLQYFSPRGSERVPNRKFDNKQCFYPDMDGLRARRGDIMRMSPSNEAFFPILYWIHAERNDKAKQRISVPWLIENSTRAQFDASAAGLECEFTHSENKAVTVARISRSR